MLSERTLCTGLTRSCSAPQQLREFDSYLGHIDC